MKKLIAIACLLALFGSNVSLIASATADSSPVEEIIVETAWLINKCYISISEDNGNLALSGYTVGTGTMHKIGFTDIQVQRSNNGLVWTTEKTLPDMLASVASSYSLNRYSVNVEGGYYYRVTWVHYAEEGGWFGNTQTVENTSNIVWIS